MNDRGSRRARAPIMVSGKSTAVRATRKSEMPSMPSDQWIPRPVAQVWSLTIWNPPSWAVKLTRTAAATARVSTVTATPTASWNQEAMALRGITATTAAPMAGTRTRVVR
jgi:hypothetical protein